MNRLFRLWQDCSIGRKCSFLVVIMLLVTWFLVALSTQQLYGFTRETGVIMTDYQDISTFLDAFSAENVLLETLIRPNHGANTMELYFDAIVQTRQRLGELQRHSKATSTREQALIRAISNAMDNYRSDQNQLLLELDSGNFIAQYLSLKTQSTYIDGYGRQILDFRISQGNEQYRLMEQQNHRSTQRFLVFVLLSTLVLVLSLILFIHSIVKPLTELGRAADEICAGRYDAPPLHPRGDDELGRTGKSFNLMQAEIRRTIAALEKEAEMEKHLLEKEVEAAQMQQALQEGRFAQLQSQINPHFLFNTLSTIAALSREEQAPLSEDLILRLSRFFRYSLESDERMVTLGREIQLLRDYMELQESRYGERIRMEVLSNHSCEAVPVPKFILQPLVENAILHGLRTRSSGGQIRIRVRRSAKGLCITVSDNGQGFAAQGWRESTVPTRHVGLRNIAERMQLCGGRLDIFSRPGLGTCARITLAERAEEAHA